MHSGENKNLKYLPLIWAALRRKPAEAILTLLAITVGFMLFGLMIGLHGMYQVMVDSARMDRVDIASRYPDAAPQGVPIAMLNEIAQIKGVHTVGGNKGWTAFYHDRANFCWLQGFTEGMRQGYSDLPLTSAQWDRLFATPNGAYITRKAAARMQLEEGDTMSVFLTPPPGGATHADLIVLGVMDDIPRWDEHEVLVSFDTVDRLRPLEERNTIWEIRAVVDPDEALEVAQRIDRHFATSGIPTLSAPSKVWAIRNANAGLPITAITWTVATIGLFVVLLLVGNGIADSVQERTAELAVLNTLGFSQARIRGLVLAESLIPCLVGAIVGTTLAPLLAAVPRRLLLPGTGSDPRPTTWIEAAAWAIACAVLIGLAGAAIPMLRLARLRVADALAGR